MSSIGVGDWMRLYCGDRVCRHDDPRHVGRVEAIHHSYLVTVRWADTGWVSFELLDDLRNLTRYVNRSDDNGC